MSIIISLVMASAQWLGPKPPPAVARLVTIAPSLTETVMALGAANVLVGVSRFDEAPEVKHLRRVGGFTDPSVETVLALKPDLVVVQKSPGNQRPIEALAALGVPVLALPLQSLDDVGSAIRELGVVLGKTTRASELIEELASARRKARAEAPAKPPSVLLVYGFSPLVVAGPGSFADELLSDCGAKNVVQKAPTAYPVWSKESLVARPPTVLVDASDSPEGREAIRALTPRTRWVTLPNKDLLHPGPALARGIESLCRSLAPPAR